MTREKSHIAKSSSSGFTLVETSVVVVLTALMLVAVIAMVHSWLAQGTQTANQQRMAAIQQALANYQTQHNRLPCPSSFIAKTSNPAFAHEVTYPATTGCPPPYVPVAPNTYAATGRTGSTDPDGGTVVATPPVIIGALPVRDLGLPDSYRTDSYGYMYTYAVTQSETATLNAFAGAIDVVEQTGNTILPLASDGTPGTATYVVVDPGKDGKGAFTADSTAAAFGTTPKITCASAPGLDKLNCDFETGAPAPIQFRSAPYSEVKGAATWFDDMIIYSASNSSSLTSSTQVCITKYSDKTAAGAPVVPGVAAGHHQFGLDAGSFLDGGTMFFVVFIFANKFSPIDIVPPAFTAATEASPTAVAYCPASFNVLAGGCTQTLGAPVQVPAVTGPVTNTDNSGAYMGASQSCGLGVCVHDVQIVPPPLSHPAMPNAAGQQGWECNGSSASGMQTQAYAVCCAANGG